MRLREYIIAGSVKDTDRVTVISKLTMHTLTSGHRWYTNAILKHLDDEGYLMRANESEVIFFA